MTDFTPSPLKIAIVGGGISGLTAAYTIARARANGAPVDALLVEASGRWGGLIRTENIEDFTIEAGPDSFLAAKPEAVALCRELGLAAELIGSNDATRRTYIVNRGKLETLPGGLMFFVPARLWTPLFSPLFPLRSKLAMARDFFRFGPPRPISPDETVADFVRRHLGSEVLETIVDPLLAGVYGGDSAQLSARAVLPALVEIERRGPSLVRGVIAARTSARPAEPVFTTLKSGVEELPRALVAQLNASSAPGSCRLILNEPIESVEALPCSAGAQPRYRIHCRTGIVYEADAIILALPGTECARLLRPLDRLLSQHLAAIPYAPSVTISLAYRSLDQRLPRGFGFLVPRREGRRLLAATFVHAKFSHRAPPGAALLRCFIGGSRQPDVCELTDEQLLEIARRELREILKLHQEPAFYRVSRWPVAMPQYVVGHQDRVAEIECRLPRRQGLFLAGNTYHGIGISDCIRSGRAAAEQAIAYAARSANGSRPAQPTA
ncbi:MAG: protoporphyrinogen oxidase [Terriglobia bacterium]